MPSINMRSTGCASCFKSGKGERECVHVELCVSRRVKLRLEPINEMAHERVDMLLG